MRNIRKIFCSDIRGLTRHFFALVIAIGLCVLPALYAWFNIYANWDPYANTGNIRIAVASLDEGCLDMSGEPVNMGDSIVDELKEKTNIGWVFVDTQKEAEERVCSGDCYAAIVIDKDFSYSMYNALAENLADPKITYYENEKKNAVATKITDTAVSTLETSINQTFVKVLTEKIFVRTNGLQEQIRKENAVDAFIGKLETVQACLDDYDAKITAFLAGGEELNAKHAGENLEACQKLIAAGVLTMESGQADLSETEDSFASFSLGVAQSLDAIQAGIDALSTDIAEAQLEGRIDVLTQDVGRVLADAADLSGQFESLAKYLRTLQGDTDGLHNTIDTVESVRELVDTIADAGGVEGEGEDAKLAIDAMQRTLTGYSRTVENINSTFGGQISPQVVGLLGNMSQVLGSTEDLLENLSGTLDGMKDIFDGVDTTLSTLNMSLAQLQGILRQTADKLDALLGELSGVSDSEAMDIIMNLLAGNPGTYSEFFSNPVHVEEFYEYEIANYGSGVAPFYTVLAIWVGMTILVSILKVHADKADFPDAKPHELFLGRYILFFLLSQMQTAVIVLGDLYLFGIQCLHPFEFWLAAAVTSLTFSLLIYALTISFGDIGKAAAVVVMVLQIAGSGGTYPIEALPAFFRAVYLFFPFPYAINAMRECIGGMYHQDYTIYLLKLLIFCAAALFIGLVVRIPFMGINHFIEKRMEDTEMM